jgi:hypothetical protein
MSTIIVKCADCGVKYGMLNGCDRIRSLCRACRPAPQPVQAAEDDYNETVSIECLADVLGVTEAYMKGVSRRKYGGAVKFTPEMAEKIAIEREAAK